MKLLFVASELEPFAYTGGLGEVIRTLPKELAEQGNEVIVVIPRYAKISQKTDIVKEFEFVFNSENAKCRLETAKVLKTKVKYYFIGNEKYFDREEMYMYADDGERFSFFSKATLELLSQLNFYPDYIVCNDWQTGAIPFMLKEKYSYIKEYSKIKSAYIIHNIEYQGVFGRDHLRFLDVDESYFTMEKLEFYGQINYAKMGMKYADKVITVSPSYSEEVYKYEYGFGLDGVVNSLTNKVIGILNGIEYEDMSNFNKKVEKEKLQKKVKLKQNNCPIISFVTRLVDQKGIDILIEALDKLIQKDIQIIGIGTGKEYYETKLAELAYNNPDKVYFNNEFNPKLAEMIYKGSDIFIMPSLFEPCGLGQLKAMKYGTVPVVRETGGLKDTVKDVESDKESGTGFIFKDYSSDELALKIEQAIGAYANKRRWNKIVKNGMVCRYTCGRSAKGYIKEFRGKK